MRPEAPICGRNSDKLRGRAIWLVLLGLAFCVRILHAQTVLPLRVDLSSPVAEDLAVLAVLEVDGQVRIVAAGGVYGVKRGQLVRVGEARDVRAVAQTGETLWIGTRSGLYRQHGTTEKKLLTGLLVDLVEPIGDGVWVRAQSAGDPGNPQDTGSSLSSREYAVYRIEGETPDMVAPFWVHQITEVGEAVWLATPRGAYKILGETRSKVLPEDSVTAIVEAGGVAWITTESKTYRVDADVPREFLDQAANHIREVNGEIWIATDQGAYRLSGSTAQHYQDRTHFDTIYDVDGNVCLSSTYYNYNSCYLTNGGIHTTACWRLSTSPALWQPDSEIWLPCRDTLTGYSSKEAALSFPERNISLPARITSLKVVDGQLWVGTDRGAFLVTRDIEIAGQLKHVSPWRRAIRTLSLDRFILPGTFKAEIYYSIHGDSNVAEFLPEDSLCNIEVAFRGPFEPAEVASLSLSPGDSLVGMQIRDRWKNVDRTGRLKIRSTWSLLFLLSSGIVILVIMTRSYRSYRMNPPPMDVVRRFFQQASPGKIRTASAHLLFVEFPDFSTLVALWPEAYGDVLEVTNKRAEHEKVRLYLVHQENRTPSIETIQVLRRDSGCDVVPLPLSSLNRALDRSESCAKLLKDLEAPYLIRTDPYLELSPITDPNWFYGRGDLVALLPQVLLKGQHVGIFGMRRVGKTSLVQLLLQRLGDLPMAFLDLQGFDRAELIFAEILGQLHVSMGSTATIPEEISGERFRTDFLALRATRKKAGSEVPFLVAFDELDSLLPGPDSPRREEHLHEYVQVFRMLRSLAQQHQALVMLGIAMRPDFSRKNTLPGADENPMYGSVQDVFLKALEPDESAALIRELGSWKDIVWDEAAIRQVYEDCGGHPFVTRIFASHACRQGELKQVSAERLEATAREIVAGLRNHQIGDHFKDGVWDRLTSDEQEILAALTTGELKSLAQLSLEKQEGPLATLEHTGLVEVDEEERFHVPGRLFRVWLERRFG
jgi:hypothetical protein